MRKLRRFRQPRMVVPQVPRRAVRMGRMEKQRLHRYSGVSQMDFPLHFRHQIRLNFLRVDADENHAVRVIAQKHDLCGNVVLHTRIQPHMKLSQQMHRIRHGECCGCISDQQLRSAHDCTFRRLPQAIPQ